MHPAREAVGAAAWAQLMHQFGGREIAVPKTRRSRVWRDLASCMGVVAADALVDLYGGDRLAVPLGAHLSRQQRNAVIARLRADGLTPEQIAATYSETRRYCSRSVKRILAAQPSLGGATPDLFDPPGPGGSAWPA